METKNYLDLVFNMKEDIEYTEEVLKAKNIEFVIEYSICFDSATKPIFTVKSETGEIKNVFLQMEIDRSQLNVKKFKYNLDNLSCAVLFEYRNNIYVANFAFSNKEMSCDTLNLICIEKK